MTQKKNKNKVLVGILELHVDGYGFVVPEKKKKELDVFVPPSQLCGAMDGDRVEVEVTGTKGKRRSEGRILNVLERSKLKVVGTYEHSHRGPVVVCRGRRRPLILKVEKDRTGQVEFGQTVLALITQYPDNQQSLKGDVLEILGARGEMATEIQVTIAEKNIRTAFPEIVIQEAEALQKEIPKSEFEKRVDLRKLPLITIDGENAKDFDDAVYVQKTEKGFRLFVAIADVSYYVVPHTKLDQEAYIRATSVYFPDRCIPMLPEALSNDLCSLRPHEDRPTFVAEIDFDQRGKKISSKFYKAIICSAARLTYTQVKRMMLDLDISLRKQYDFLIDSLEDAFELFELLRGRRMARGSIDFDLPEPEIIVDVEEGVATAILKRPRNKAHMLIEEFMLAANEAVASFFAEHKDDPAIYRIHETPDLEKITDFVLLAQSLGHALPPASKVRAKDLAKTVDQAKGKKYERLINTVLLRSLKQAIYSSQNLGHFGLASKCYTHFTSPIRRYPDLIVHRVLSALLDKKRKIEPYSEEKISEMASHCSRMERVAMKAEWDVRDLHVALFMKDKIGEEFKGVISSVTRFGFFVELLDFFVEGLVHLNTLEQDDYEFDEKRHELHGKLLRKKFKIGDEVTVQVVKVGIEQRKVDFCLKS